MLQRPEPDARANELWGRPARRERTSCPHRHYHRAATGRDRRRRHRGLVHLDGSRPGPPTVRRTRQDEVGSGTAGEPTVSPHDGHRSGIRIHADVREVGPDSYRPIRVRIADTLGPAARQLREVRDLYRRGPVLARVRRDRGTDEVLVRRGLQPRSPCRSRTHRRACTAMNRPGRRVRRADPAGGLPRPRGGRAQGGGGGRGQQAQEEDCHLVSRARSSWLKSGDSGVRSQGGGGRLYLMSRRRRQRSECAFGRWNYVMNFGRGTLGGSTDC
jgi:hypothetical protein